MDDNAILSSVDESISVFLAQGLEKREQNARLLKAIDCNAYYAQYRLCTGFCIVPE
jgi:hypothetical protein